MLATYLIDCFFDDFKVVLFYILDVWQRATKRQPPSESDGIVLRFEIPYARIVPTQNETNSNTKKFIAYDISIQQDSAKSPDSNPTTIERRYSHFKRLYDALKKDHPKLMQMAFPKKVLMGNFAADLIAERSSAFESLLDYIVQVNELKDSPHFLEFLQVFIIKSV